VFEEVRRLRNDYVHRRPATKRHRFRYRGHPLLTKDSVRRLFVDVELILRTLRTQSGRYCDWATIPQGYASEMNWPAKYVEAIEGKQKHLKRLAALQTDR
jgi:hypothetical protein